MPVKLLVKIKEKAGKLKSEAQVLMIAYNDKRIPLSAKILIGITIGYLLSPIDLVPDFIPILGLLDDLIIVPLLIMVSIKLIPSIILEEARQKVKSDPQSLKKSNWTFGVLIIILWLILLWWLISIRK